MKILFSDNLLSGLLNFRGAVIRHFLADGHEVVLVAPHDASTDPGAIPAGAKYIPVGLSRTGTNPFEDLRYYRALREIYRAERPDYIFHYTIKPNIYGTLAASHLGIRSTAMIAGLGHVFTGGGRRNVIARSMYKYAMRFPEHVIALNRENRDTLLGHHIVPPRKLILLGGGEGVDLSSFTPRPMPSNAKPVFLMICRLLYEKGYAEYVAAAEALRGKAEFRLMGPFDDHPAAVKRSTLENDVRRGVIDYIAYSPDVVSQIAAADCVVLSSYAEGLSRVLMEGAAMGRPLIATDIAGCREAVDDGRSGYLVPPRDARALTDACERFAALSRNERQTMGRAGRRIAERRFDVGDVCRVYGNIIERAVAHG